MDRLKIEAHASVPLFEDAPLYDDNLIARMGFLMNTLTFDGGSPEMLEEYLSLKAQLKPVREKEKIFLWPEGNMPAETEYTDNSDLRYNHDPDFVPYMYEFLLPEDVTPKGALIAIAGGDHGCCSVFEGYQICKDFSAKGYQTFMLNNRTNRCPWNEYECGADAARAIRYIRKNAAKYRIREDQVAVAGFSNGGLTGENCILHYSGKKTVQDHFPDYRPDELDEYYGAPDAFICVYGPRYAGAPYDFDGVIYPPTFFAVGREDKALDNLNYCYPLLLQQGVKMEVHTYAGVPHGVAGRTAGGRPAPYPLFETWETFADAFLQDLWK